MSPEGSTYTSPSILDPLTVAGLTGTLVGLEIVVGLIPAIRAAQIPQA